MLIRPYLIAHRLIPQLTWGGTYIASHKKIEDESVKSMMIGQSYELTGTSSLSSVERSGKLPVEIADSKLGDVVEVVGDRSSLFSLPSLIDQDPEHVLGKKVSSAHKKMPLLIKFTQAKGNSFQVHVHPGAEFNHWKPKPESWYFFEKGKVTLGLKKPLNVEAYKKVCKEIEMKANELASSVKGKGLSISEARKELASFITQYSPYQYVNELTVDAGTIVDLSAGGIHHSWEEGAEIQNGNIVYEVQVDVMDNECTLRSFDKGKIGDDGSLRPIHINEYFQALDIDEVHNDPMMYMKKSIVVPSDGIEKIPLFETLHYSACEFSFAKEYTGSECTTDAQQSFHHLFVKRGDISIQAGSTTLFVGQGNSVFIPACTGAYTLRTDTTAQVIKTWM
ncbi:hypothetical protein C5B42_02130 [Candidatus Cerribacteria bacterium 'Amazon FNV 2010 28 9']|uniref:Mannose-6-phosphate isomerase n=1 Tax=Candidatus Cerribacteria bacterium 'Amazon FNV 2010 28 9' TaxID=2081795 RepID=A0A317JUC1_9BACT|nr:MAG: hypothetical protein C5B42_02130 [Candidatus Cerribacteria bacterium 'Amazon FNV 2010 28 9']